MEPDRKVPSRYGFIGVRRTEDCQVRRRAQTCQVLSGLMCRSNFSESNAVMGEDKCTVGSHHRREAYSGPHVIGEAEKC